MQRAHSSGKESWTLREYGSCLCLSKCRCSFMPVLIWAEAACGCADVLSGLQGCSPLNILARYDVCRAVVYVVNDVLWPSNNPTYCPKTDLGPNTPALW